MVYQRVTGCVPNVETRTLHSELLATCENAVLRSQLRMYVDHLFLFSTFWNFFLNGKFNLNLRPNTNATIQDDD